MSTFRVSLVIKFCTHWGDNEDVRRKVIVISPCLLEDINSVTKIALLDAADKCVLVDFVLLEKVLGGRKQRKGSLAALLATQVRVANASAGCSVSSTIGVPLRFTRCGHDIKVPDIMLNADSRANYCSLKQERYYWCTYQVNVSFNLESCIIANKFLSCVTEHLAAEVVQLTVPDITKEHGNMNASGSPNNEEMVNPSRTKNDECYGRSKVEANVRAKQAVIVDGGYTPSKANIIVFSTVHPYGISLSDSDKKKLPHLLRWMDYPGTVVDELPKVAISTRLLLHGLILVIN
ncbi:glutathione S-transferase [Tanacetum coccineum]